MVSRAWLAYGRHQSHRKVSILAGHESDAVSFREAVLVKVGAQGFAAGVLKHRLVLPGFLATHQILDKVKLGSPVEVPFHCKQPQRACFSLEECCK